MKHVINTNEVPNLSKGEMLAGQDKYGIIEWNPTKAVLFECDRTYSLNELDKKFKEEKYLMLNAVVCEYLIAYPELIPDEWKDTIYFIGTLISCPTARWFPETSVRSIKFDKEQPAISTHKQIDKSFIKGDKIALYFV